MPALAGRKMLSPQKKIEGPQLGNDCSWVRYPLPTTADPGTSASTDRTGALETALQTAADPRRLRKARKHLLKVLVAAGFKVTTVPGLATNQSREDPLVFATHVLKKEGNKLPPTVNDLLRFSASFRCS